MERNCTDRRRRQPKITGRCRQARRRDRRHHEGAQAIRMFQEWDREMTRIHGRLYNLALGYSVHYRCPDTTDSLRFRETATR
jgi:hypothetical protein